MQIKWVLRFVPLRWRRFWFEDLGEVAPVTYLATLPIALLFIFFALDVGLRKGARLAVEYAAFCAARAAAVSIPAPDGTCQDATEQARHAAAACLASVTSKKGTGSPGTPPNVNTLVGVAAARTTVKLTYACQRNATITAEVSYLYGPELPYSPLRQPNGLTITASAQAMLQSVK